MPYKIAIETVRSGPEAIAKIKDGEVYDIIFMDHMMPEMSGIEATNIIHDMGYDQPIIALTANALNDAAEMFMSNGFSGFISKPIDLDQLDKHLLRFIRDKQPAEIIDLARKAKVHSPLNPETDYSNGLPDILVTSFLWDSKNALSIIEPIVEKQILDANDLKTYTIQAHAMKSALHNINNPELSKVASVLETAGRGADIKTIKGDTPAFLDRLREIIEKLEPRKEQGISDEDEDPDFLKEQLLVIKEACNNYDIGVADKALGAIMEKNLSKQTKALLDAISDHLLCGELEEAATLIAI